MIAWQKLARCDFFLLNAGSVISFVAALIRGNLVKELDLTYSAISLDVLSTRGTQPTQIVENCTCDPQTFTMGREIYITQSFF